MAQRNLGSRPILGTVLHPTSIRLEDKKSRTDYCKPLLELEEAFIFVK
ncbi:UNVERIFIED_ORG: hypothetical protein ABIC97_000191 [Peribacillus simplex]